MNTHNQNGLLLFRLVFILFVVCFSVGAVQAAENLQKNAESGDATAQFALGRNYTDNGRSLEDLNNAYFWTRKAAEQGMGKAQFHVADMYCSGSGVTQSYIHAYAWHSLAAQNGVTAAEEKMEILEELFLTADDIQKALEIAGRFEGEK